MLKKSKIWILLAILVWINVSIAANKDIFGAKNFNVERLEAKQVFQLKLINENNKNTLKWDIYPNHYLYKDKIIIIKEYERENITSKIDFPKHAELTDKVLGEIFKVYANELRLELPRNILGKIKVNYQGCAADGFCYAPQEKIFTINNSFDDKSSSNDADRKELLSQSQGYFKNLINTNSLLNIVVLFFGFGLLLAFTPCVLPMIPILLSIVIGEKKVVSKKYGLLLACTYVISMSLVYAAAGVVAGHFGYNFQAYMQKPFIIILVSLFIIFVGLELMEIIKFKMPTSTNLKIYKLEKTQNQGSIINAAILGALSALVLSPCITPAFAGVMAFLAKEGSPLKGGIALFFMGLGIGAPLIIFAIGGNHLLPRTGGWMISLKKLVGIILIAMAVFITNRITDSSTSLLLWGMFVFFIAFYLLTINSSIKRIYYIKNLLALILFIYGVLLALGGLSWGKSLTHPLKHLKTEDNIVNASKLKWQSINSIEKLEQILATSKKSKLIFFSAKWCTSCEKMKKHVFTNDNVIKNVLDHELILIDITNYDDENVEKLMNKFQVFGPPALILLDKNSNLKYLKRKDGYVNAKEVVNLTNN